VEEEVQRVEEGFECLNLKGKTKTKTKQNKTKRTNKQKIKYKLGKLEKK
jgi:hypothetical protein